MRGRARRAKGKGRSWTEKDLTVALSSFSLLASLFSFFRALFTHVHSCMASLSSIYLGFKRPSRLSRPREAEGSRTSLASTTRRTADPALEQVEMSSGRSCLHLFLVHVCYNGILEDHSNSYMCSNMFRNNVFALLYAPRFQ